MDIFDYCLKAICKESDKCKIFFNEKTCEIKNSRDEKFDNAANRLAYLYRYGIFSVHFLKKCFLTFANNYSQSLNVIEQISLAKSVCSLSIGPGMDIIGLLFAFMEIGKTFSEETSFKIINKSGAWRNSMNVLTSVTGPNIPDFGNFKLIECDILKLISPKAQNYIKAANVVLMDHAFESPKTKQEDVSKTLKAILRMLNANTYVILIDFKDKMTYVQSFTSLGEFIYGPIEVKVADLPFGEKVVQTIGVAPICFGQSFFGIWQKRAASENVILDKSMLVNVVPSPQKKGEYSNNNVSTLSSQSNSVPGTPLKKPVACSTPVGLNSSNASSSINPNSNLIFKQSDDVSYPLQNSSNMQESVPIQKGSRICYDKDTLLKLNKIPEFVLKKNGATNKESQKNDKPPSKNEIDTLLKSVDKLISKFEVLVDAGLVPNNSNSTPVCLQIRPNSNNCPCSCHCQCRCLGNSVNTHKKFAEMKTDDYKNEPHIVIPLQNMNPNSVAQIISLVTQKKS